MCVVYVSDSEELLPKSSRCLYIFFFCITDPLHSTLQCYCVQRAIFKMKKKEEVSGLCPAQKWRGTRHSTRCHQAHATFRFGVCERL